MTIFSQYIRKETVKDYKKRETNELDIHISYARDGIESEEKHQNRRLHFFYCEGIDRILATEFIISRIMKSNAIDFVATSERIWKLRVRSKFRKLSLLNVGDKGNDIKEKNYDKIELICNSCLKYDVGIECTYVHKNNMW